jgi:anti-sigma-K factor RskA
MRAPFGGSWTASVAAPAHASIRTYSASTVATFAAIRSPQNEVLWTVARAADGQLHVSNLRPMTIPQDQNCLLWLKTGDAPPVMLGVLPDDGSARTLAMPAGLAHPVQEGELWVTMQPMTHTTPPARPTYQ